MAHRRLGEVYCELGQLDDALSHHRLFLAAAEQQQDRLELQRATATVGRTYLLQVTSPYCPHTHTRLPTHPPAPVSGWSWCSRSADCAARELNRPVDTLVIKQYEVIMTNPELANLNFT